MAFVNSDMLLGSHRLIEELMKQSAPVDYASMFGNPMVRRDSFLGIPFRSSPHFPTIVNCSTCDGSGEGGDNSTYCEKCEGRGGFRYDGMMQDRGRTIMIKSADPLPKKFSPYFPREIALIRRPASGSREVPWPQSLR